MASLEEENEAKVARLMKRARLKHRDIPKIIRALDADIRTKRQIKDMKAALDKTTTGTLIKLTEGIEDLARFFLKQKLYTEIKVPTTRVVRAPELTPTSSAEVYVAVAVAVRIFLLKYHKAFGKSAKP